MKYIKSNISKRSKLKTLTLFLTSIILICSITSYISAVEYKADTGKIAWNSLESISTTDGTYYSKLDLTNYGRNMSTCIHINDSIPQWNYDNGHHVDSSRVTYQKKFSVSQGTAVNLVAATKDSGSGGIDTVDSAKMYWNVMEWSSDGSLVYDSGWLDCSKSWVVGVSEGGTTYGVSVKPRNTVSYITLIFRTATGNYAIGSYAPNITPKYLNDSFENIYLCYKPFEYTVKGISSTYKVNRVGMTATSNVVDNQVKTGHDFLGWKVVSSNTVGGTNWMNGQTYSSSKINEFTSDGKFYTSLFGNMTFEASFTPSTYNVKFNPNGGTVSTTNKNVTYGSKYGDLPTPVNPGFTFKGWKTSSDGGTLVTKDTTVTATADHELYASWDPILYNVTFDKQGGTGGTDSIKAQFTKLFPYAEKPSKGGYTFNGYRTEKNGLGDLIYDNYMVPKVNYTYSYDITLYAHWIDAEPPSLTFSGLNEWTNKADTLTAKASDSASGLKSIKIYRINSDGTEVLVQSKTFTGESGTLTYDNTVQGITQYKAVATDKQGNSVMSYITSYYDIVGPTGDVIEVTLSGTNIKIELDVTDIND